ncbi:MAG: hypothetical protein K9M80_05085 [Candidatus Marinimicrobia bacterium]|nr:hypothetical protein [Candidatus Neomarinimicrobiota bacterium]
MQISIENSGLENIYKTENSNSKQANNNARILKIKEKAREMESLFLTQVVKAMRKTVPKNSQEESKNDLPSMMFSSVMGKALSKSGGIGLAKKISESLMKMDNQELEKFQEEQLDNQAININAWDFLKSNPSESFNE